MNGKVQEQRRSFDHFSMLLNLYISCVLMNLIDIIPAADYAVPANGLRDRTLRTTVAEIIEAVMDGGDRTLLAYTRRFDHIEPVTLRVPSDRVKTAAEVLDPETRRLLEQAIDNIASFHRRQILKSWQQQDSDGTILGEKVTPLDRVGIYVPGGKAFYPSTLLMNTIPARLAGVPSIAVVSPPGPDGYPHPLVLAVCALLELPEIYVVGGAQAIAALAYGTETIKPVCKITGPGNRFVAEAKRQVFGRVGIDSVAGPSEIVILHDDPTIPVEYLVRDLLTQAEHDEEARPILITTDGQTAERVQSRINQLVPHLPRNEIMAKSLKNHGGIVHCTSLEEGFDLVNRLAPEHLELLLTTPEKIDQIRNAGAVFVGRWSTETVGDYFAGPNHTIPTGGAARYGSPLSVRDFQKHTSLIQYSEARLNHQGELIARFAELEGLPAHAAAVYERLRKDRS
jgi:histidinol dehydrogenase